MSGLEELLDAASRALDARPAVPLVLATLHTVDGSSYRQPGARLLVDVEGRVLAGAVSGGCLEGDVAAHAESVHARGLPKLLTYDLRDDLQVIWGFGAQCDGVAHLLLEPLQDLGWLEAAVACREARATGSLVTRLDESRHGGTRFLNDRAESLPDALRDLVEVARNTGAPVSGRAPDRDDATPAEHASGGSLYLIDPLLPPVSLVLIGAGRGAESFAAIAGTLGWRVTVVDHRPFVLEGLTLAPTVSRVVARAAEGLPLVGPDARTAIALLTHQFALDTEWLTQLFTLPVGYIGVLGSRLRASQLLDAVRDGGLTITPAMHRLLHAPIGLDLGGEAPESIALAAIAEIEAVMHGRPGGALRERQSPIHSRTPTPRIPA